jgi:dihydrofolate reductase
MGRIVATENVTLDGVIQDPVGEERLVPGGDIVLYSSWQLVPTLMKYNLFDEVRLMTLPLLVGTGRRVFDDVGGPTPLRLIATRTVGHSLVLLTYRPVRNT